MDVRVGGKEKENKGESKRESDKKEEEDDSAKLVCTTTGAWKLNTSYPLGTYFNPRGGRKNKKVYAYKNGKSWKCHKEGCREYGHPKDDCSNPNLLPPKDEEKNEDQSRPQMHQRC